MALKETERQFIPPQSAITRRGPLLSGLNFFSTEGYQFTREKVRVQGFKKKLRKAAIAREHSPFAFRIYLTLVLENDGREEERVFDQSFYVSEIARTKADPNELYPKALNNNKIILQQSTTTGSLLTIAAVVGIIALLAAIEGG